jgi:alpha-1,2-mannosyltransferase
VRIDGWTTRRPLLLVLVAGGLLAVAAAVVVDLRLAASYRPGETGDISVYIGALRNLDDGGALYEWVDAFGYGFTYPPFAALVLQPVTWAEPDLVGRVWTIAQLVIAPALAAIVVLKRHPRLPALAGVVALCVGAFVLLLSTQLQGNLIAGQVSVLLILMVLADVGEVVPVRVRGVLVGIAAAVKLTPLIVLPWYAVTRQWATLARSAAAFAGCTALGWVVLPDESRAYWGGVVTETERVGELMYAGNQSMLGLLARASVEPPLRTVLWLLVGGLLVLAAYWRAARSRRLGDPVAAAVLLGIASLVASPVSWPFHQIWLPLAAFVLLLRPRLVPVVAGAAVAAICVLHSSVVPALDRAGLHDVGVNLEVLVFAVLCVTGLGVPGRSGLGDTSDSADAADPAVDSVSA